MARYGKSKIDQKRIINQKNVLNQTTSDASKTWQFFIQQSKCYKVFCRWSTNVPWWYTWCARRISLDRFKIWKWTCRPTCWTKIKGVETHHTGQSYWWHHSITSHDTRLLAKQHNYATRFSCQQISQGSQMQHHSLAMLKRSEGSHKQNYVCKVLNEELETFWSNWSFIFRETIFSVHAHLLWF